MVKVVEVFATTAPTLSFCQGVAPPQPLALQVDW